jgi:hypothetical protein
MPKPASKLPSRLRVTRHQPNISSSNGQRENQSSNRDKRTPRSLGYHTIPPRRPPQRRHGKPKKTITAPSLFLLFKLIHLSTLPRFLRGKKETAMTKNHYTKEEIKKSKYHGGAMVLTFSKFKSAYVSCSFFPECGFVLRCALCSHSFVVARSEGGTRGGTTTLTETLTQGPT